MIISRHLRLISIQLLVVFVFITLPSCTVWNPATLAPEHAPLSNKLPALALEIKQGAKSEGGGTDEVIEQDIRTLIERDIEENTIDPYSDPAGRIVATYRFVDAKGGIGLVLLQTLTLYIPMLLGVPTNKARLWVELQYEFFDKDDKLIGKYIEQGYSMMKFGLYKGKYSLGSNNLRYLFVLAFQDALNNLRPKIEADLPRLHKALSQ